MLEHTILARQDDGSTHQYALVQRDSDSRCTVVIIDDRRNQVLDLSRKAYGSPAYSSAAVEAVAKEWTTEARARRTYEHLTMPPPLETP